MYHRYIFNIQYSIYSVDIIDIKINDNPIAENSAHPANFVSLSFEESLSASLSQIIARGNRKTCMLSSLCLPIAE